MKVGTMGLTAATESMPANNALKPPSFAFASYIDKISNCGDFRYGYFLANFITFRIGYSEFLDMIKAFPSGPLKVARFRFVQTRGFLFKKSYLNGVITFLRNSLFLQNCAWASFDDGNRD